jgi:hypothetical protein
LPFSGTSHSLEWSCQKAKLDRPSVRPSVCAIHTLITGDTEGCFNIESIVGQMSNFEKDVMDTIV